MNGMVYWITGLSGSGKTTIGKLLYDTLQKQKTNVIFLDGDQIREVFGNDLGYSPEERYKSAMRNARLCQFLASQGMDIICCTISMFDAVREWNRSNIPGYIEIYIKVSMETLQKRNQKFLYTNGDGQVAGINFQIQEPKNPDIILENDKGVTPEEQLSKLFYDIQKYRQKYVKRD